MSLPLWEPMPIPPGMTLVDVHSLPEDEQTPWLAAGLQLWTDETGEDSPVREWSDDEGVFVIVEDATGEIVGVTLIVDVEDA